MYVYAIKRQPFLDTVIADEHRLPFSHCKRLLPYEGFRPVQEAPSINDDFLASLAHVFSYRQSYLGATKSTQKTLEVEFVTRRRIWNFEQMNEFVDGSRVDISKTL